MITISQDIRSPSLEDKSYNVYEPAFVLINKFEFEICMSET